MPATWPTLVLEIEFDAGVWTDVTADLITGTTNRGRSTPLEAFPAGTASFRLSNQDRQYDPLYTSGTYYGDLLPGKRIRLKGTWNSVDYDIWTGYIDRWTNDYDGPRAGFCTVDCTDAFGKLAQIQLPNSIYATFIEAASPTAWWRLSETAGSDVHDVSGGNSHGYFTTPAATDRVVPSLIVGDTDATCIDFDGVQTTAVLPKRGAQTSFPWSFECWFRTSTATTSGPGIYWCSDGTNILDIYLAGGSIRTRLTTVDGSVLLISTTDRNVVDGRRHHLAVTYNDATSAPEIWIDGVSSPSNTASATGTGVLPSAAAFLGMSKTTGYKWVGQLAEVALYNSAFNDLAAAVHYAAGIAPLNGQDTGARVSSMLDLIDWDSSARQVDVGISNLGPANYESSGALAYLQDLEATEAGRLFVDESGNVVFKSRHSLLLDSNSATAVATFDDRATANRYSDVEFSSGYDLVYNVVKVSAIGGVEQTVQDDTSIATYGPKVLSLGQLLWRTPNEARAIADWLLYRFKDAAPRVTRLVLRPRPTPNTIWARALGLQLGDRIAVKRIPQGVGSTINLSNYIESVSHSFDAVAREWETTFECSAVIPGTWAAWDSSRWSTSGGWAA